MHNRTFTGSEVADAVIGAAEAVKALGEDTTIVEIAAGENMTVTVTVDGDYYAPTGDLRTYVWDGEQLRQSER